MTVIELGTQTLRPQKNHSASACDEGCVTESVQERQYIYCMFIGDFTVHQSA
jgi:hypothetical protein